MKRLLATLFCLIIALSPSQFAIYASDGDNGSVNTASDVAPQNDEKSGSGDTSAQTLNEETTSAQSTETTTVATTGELSKTKLEGLSETLNQSYELGLTVSVTVSPANPARTVMLQRFVTSSKRYETVKTYRTKQAQKAKLKLTFPKKYRKKTEGKWRVVVEESENASAYISPVITLTSRNLADLKLNARASCVYCIESGQVVYGKQMNAVRKQASTTKIMTAVLLIESGKLDGKTTVTKAITKTPYANVCLHAGDTMRNRDLLYSMMLPSSNDSAAAIALGVSSSQSAFVKKMNEKAKKLGLKNTVYSNPHGLDSRKNHTTAYELARLVAYASQYDEFNDVIAKARYSFYSVKHHRHITVLSTDKLKGYSSRHIGGKTGFTSGAKYCFASVYKYKGKHYAVIVMGNGSVNKRWKDMKKLYKYIDKYSNTKY